MKPKRRRYTADPMAMYRVVGGAQPFTAAEQLQLSLPVRVAFERVRTGQAVEGDFDTLAAAANLSMVCAERIDPAAEQACVAGVAALMRMHVHHLRHGRWLLDGPGLQQVADTIDIYEQLTTLLTAGQVHTALLECHRRMRAGQVMEVVPA